MARKNRTLGLKLKAIDRMSSVIDKVSRKFPKLTRSIKRASRVAQIFNAQTKRMSKSLKKLGGGMKRFGLAMTLGVTLPIVAAGAAGVKTFATYEQGLRGIEKTTGLARDTVAKLGDRFSALSTKIPVSTKEMLTLARAGGQLGIQGVADLEKFTITMAKLGRATDVAGEDGAKSIARILTVTGDGIGKVERFSSALVDLGNNAAAGEQEILEVATRVAGQIGRFDVASAKVLGIATALRALGKRAESAGSVVGRSFDAIDQSIKKGGIQIRLLSKLTGVAVDELEQQFKKDAVDIFQKFVEGLSKVEKGNGNMIKVMRALGLEGVRINDILGTLAKRPEVLAENLDRATRAFEKNTALQKEFEIQTDSLESVMKVIGNTFTDFIKLVGKDLAPAVRFVGGIFKSVFDFLRNNPSVRMLVIVFAALAAVLGPIIFLSGAFLLILPGLTAGMVAFSAASFPITGSILAIAAGIAAAITVIVLFITHIKLIRSFFNENPFGQFLKFIFFLFTPLGQLITMVRLVVGAFSGLKGIQDVLKDTFSVFGFGDEDKAKLGAAIDARNRNRGVASTPQENSTINGNITMDFINAPAGTKVKSQMLGPLGLNLGFSGGVF